MSFKHATFKDGARIYAALDEVKARQAEAPHPQAGEPPADVEKAAREAENSPHFQTFINAEFAKGEHVVASYILHLRDVLTERHGEQYVVDLMERLCKD